MLDIITGLIHQHWSTLVSILHFYCSRTWLWRSNKLLWGFDCNHWLYTQI